MPPKPRAMSLMTEGILEKKKKDSKDPQWLCWATWALKPWPQRYYSLRNSEPQSHGPKDTRVTKLFQQFAETIFGHISLEGRTIASSWPQKSRALPLVTWRKGRGCGGGIKNSREDLNLLANYGATNTVIYPNWTHSNSHFHSSPGTGFYLETFPNTTTFLGCTSLPACQDSCILVIEWGIRALQKIITIRSHSSVHPRNQHRLFKGHTHFVSLEGHL